MTEHNGWVKFTALVAIGFVETPAGHNRLLKAIDNVRPHINRPGKGKSNL